MQLLAQWHIFQRRPFPVLGYVWWSLYPSTFGQAIASAFGHLESAVTLYICLKLEKFVSSRFKGAFLKTYGFDIILLLFALLLFVQNQLVGMFGLLSLIIWIVTFIATRNNWNRNDLVTCLIFGTWLIVGYIIWRNTGYLLMGK
ncbi:hypothetical protein CIG75_05940 [Tumebacillus algifaecis]|uniref:Uncharacterized protein n=1 Tax=Tumebacillus algifaecis TaxID=1214604 RepID=A0A223CZ24_9BACL|nr:hypothetical protein [Tumebacillus algifaecis]ASS74578.1 hypothetical protein CIG75_05940 [Tumebacillus algifaecis]